MNEWQWPEPEPVPWTPRDVWLGLSSFIIWIAVAIGLSLGASDWVADLDVDPGLVVSLAELILLLPVWLLVMRKYKVGWQALGLRSFGPAVVAMGCGLMVVSFMFNAVYGLLLGLFDLQVQADLTPLFEDLASPWLLFLGGAIIAPMVEEIFFRGFVFGGLRPRYGWLKAAMISSIAFALLHLTPTAVIPIFILGFIFALLYQISGSIWPGILMHILTNSLALGATYLIANAERFGIPL